ncbi:MAG: DNA-deoxyinosine glycosylase [Candidatus Hydrogenedentes bacterium]|nr:DNA-deoxyinosine glycosylase [Candidatus Hydrogenedentota bacterium]
MTHIHSFPPISDANATVLILGSMPGKASLRANQYYGHPQNAFWKIMDELVDAGPDLSYADRADALRSRGIALWDVLKSCTRTGSLDSDIVEDSIVTNDFAAFYDTHPNIACVFFNGAKAEHAYRKYVLPTLDTHPHIVYEGLPSTSPANAAIPYAEKLNAWTAIVNPATV